MLLEPACSFSGLIAQMARTQRRGFLSTRITISLMFITLLGLALAAAALALKKASEAKETLTPQPIRVK